SLSLRRYVFVSGPLRPKSTLFPYTTLFRSMSVANDITGIIGETPIVKLNRLVDEDSADIYVKLEFMNPGSSVKDRIALAMVEAAEKFGKLKEGDTIIEPTSGNTG